MYAAYIFFILISIFNILYKQVLRPIILYACHILGSCAKSHLNKIQTYQNKILCIITDAGFYAIKHCTMTW